MRVLDSFQSLRAKLLVIALAVAAISTLAISIVHYLELRKLGERIANERLSAIAHATAHELNLTFSSVEHDLDLLDRILTSNGPPSILDLGRSEETRGGGSENQWRRRAEDLLVALLTENPLYTQASIFGLDAEWTELVRVEARNGSIGPVAYEDFQTGLIATRLEASGELQSGDVLFSGAYDSRETSSDQQGGVFEIRALKPIFTPDDQVFGIISLTLNLDEVYLRAARTHLSPQLIKDIDLTGLETTFLGKERSVSLQRGGGNITSLQIVRVEESELSYSDILHNGPGMDTFFVRGGLAHSIVPVFGPDGNRSEGEYVVTRLSMSALMHDANAIFLHDIVVSAALTLLAGLTMGVFSAKVIAPIHDLNTAVSNFDPNSESLVLPRMPGDEIGALAEAFRALSRDLIERKKELEAVFNGAADGIVAINANGNILSFNPAAERMFGREEKSILGKNLGILMSSDDAAAHTAYVDTAERTGEVGRMERAQNLVAIDSDGLAIPVDVSVSHININGNSRYIGLIRDVSAQKDAEKKVSELVLALQRSNEDLLKFAYVSSHELKAPLRSIKATAGWLEEDIGHTLDQESRKNLDLMRGRIKRMETLLDDLLEHSKIGRVAVDQTPILSTELVEEVIDFISPPSNFAVNLEEKSVAVLVPRMPTWVIIQNLIGNAIKHHGGEKGEVLISIEESGSDVIFEVSDNGPGIPEASQMKVFEMFETLKPRDQVEGSGMGLAIVKRNVECIGGRISLCSKSGCGTRINVVIPRYHGNLRAS